MPNTKAVGVAYSDPEFETVSVTGASTLTGAVTASGGVTGNVTGTVTGNTRMSVAAVTATGSAQNDAAALSEGLNVVAGADATKGVILPTAVAGMQVIIKNNAAAALKIYPATGGAINAVATNGAYSITNLTTTHLVAQSATQWWSIPLVAS